MTPLIENVNVAMPPPVVDMSATGPEPYSIAQVAEESGFSELELERWVRAIERKKQAVLYGPPGTGKTFMAELLAKHLIGGDNGFSEVVQFHPAFAYEDFVQGIRPQPSPAGGLEYPVVAGRFVNFCERARSRTGRCVLIIDEINRANLSRVFGELMYLLEYRGRSVRLATSGELFSIPHNVRIIGTMNTADRSIALVDHALRRRFAFISLPPKTEALAAYHERNETGFPIRHLIAVLDDLNGQINDLHYSVGISFFIRPGLDNEIEDIWRMEIEPYLEEYFFDRPEKVKNFRWSQIEERIWGVDGSGG